MMKLLGLAMVALGITCAGLLAGAESPSTSPATQPSTPPAKELTLDLGNKVTLKLVRIPAGKFLMGSPKDEKDRKDNEGLPPDQGVNGSPQIEVTISHPFYLGVYVVTVDQYAQFVKDTGQKHDEPSFKQTGDHPVVNVSWDDAQAFCQWLSKKTGKTVGLPTETQWEYACRAGTKTRFSFGDKDTDLGDYAWYSANSLDKEKGARMTHSVGQKKPNAWGLYDMHGNVWEWCSDWYAESYAAADKTDPTGPKKGMERVVRGGSWDGDPGRCRSATRTGFPDGRYNLNGFRVVVTAGVD